MEFNSVILLRLLFAHFISDFFLQCNWIEEGKKSKGCKCYVYQLGHSFIHAVMSYICVAQWDNWIVPSVIFVSHFLIDFIKLKFTRNKLGVFISDQIAHVIVILLLWFFMFEQPTPIFDLFEKTLSTNHLWVIIIAYVLVVKPASIFLNLFFEKFDVERSTTGLKNAGKWIGYIERILILTFVINNNIEAVGFLLAAKSVFRFGELKDANEIKRTEYVLLGTLVSFSIAIIIGLIVNWV